jgi:phosphoadenosine phosphosulfate reductase
MAVPLKTDYPDRISDLSTEAASRRPARPHSRLPSRLPGTTVSTTTSIDLELASARLEGAPASAVVEWAIDTFGRRISLTASMADTVLIDLATKVDPDIEVVFLDTGFHFAETLQTLRRAQARYGLNVRVERPEPRANDLYAVGTDSCCAIRKVGLLDRALADKDAWMTGLRRSESPTRANTPIVGLDSRGKVKISPLANWSDADVERYIAEHDIIVNPLLAEGYLSIGCWPCTDRVVDGADPRSGRWSGSEKTECGLHL